MCVSRSTVRLMARLLLAFADDLRDNMRAALTANKAAPATAAKPSRDLTESLEWSDPA